MHLKNPSPMIAVLLILGGSISCVLGGLHAIYTLLDLRDPRWLVPDSTRPPQTRTASSKSPYRRLLKSSFRITNYPAGISDRGQLRFVQNPAS